MAVEPPKDSGGSTSYGVTEASCGCPIRSSIETVVVCHGEGFPVHFDRHAFEADHVLVCNTSSRTRDSWATSKVA